MRILLITDHHAPTGGAERYFFELKSRLKRHPGITVYSMGFASDAKQGRDYSILKKTNSKPTKFLSQHLFHPGVYNQFRRKIDLFKPDVIHLHNIKEYTKTILQALQPYPVVQTIHDYSVICPTGWNVHQDLQPCLTGLRKDCFWQHHTKFNKLSYLALAYSQYKLKSRLQKTVNAFISPSPLLTHYLQLNQFENVITISPFITKQPQFQQDQIQPYHFLYVGQLARHKGVEHLLNEFARACIKEPRLQLTLIGDGPELAMLKTKINSCGLSNKIHFAGWQSDLSSYYAKCQAVIFPSIGLESFGLVITESMSFGRPVIASHRGHSPYLIKDQETGLLYDPLKEGDLAACILKLAEQQALARQMGQNAYQQMERIDNEVVMEQILKCYAKVVV